MNLLHGDHNSVIGTSIAQWYCARVKEDLLHPPYYVFCWGDDSGPLCVAVFNNYNGSSIYIHFFGPKGLTRQVIHDIGRYVFRHLNCNTMIAVIPRNNLFKKYLPRLGFEYRSVIPGYFGPRKDGDGILFYMKKDVSYRWIK